MPPPVRTFAQETIHVFPGQKRVLALVSSAARQTVSAWGLVDACLRVKYRTFRPLSVRLLRQTTLLLQVGYRVYMWKQQLGVTADS